MLERYYTKPYPGPWGVAYEWLLTLCFAQMILISIGLDLSAWALNKLVMDGLAFWRKPNVAVYREEVCFATTCSA